MMYVGFFLFAEGLRCRGSKYFAKITITVHFSLIFCNFVAKYVSCMANLFVFAY